MYAVQYDDGIFERCDHEDEQQWWYQQDLEQQEQEYEEIAE